MTLMRNEIMQEPDAVRHCEEVNKEAMEKVVAALKQKAPSCVVFNARGSSNHAAIYGRYVLENYVGVLASSAAPSIVTTYGATPDYSKAAVIAISQSGAGQDIYEVVKMAKSQGALTIAITNSPGSIVAEEADFHLCCATSEEKSVAATKTFTLCLYMLTSLFAKWSGNEELICATSKVADVIAQTIQMEETFRAAAERYRFMSTCMVMGRGYAYSISRELALKMQETCYVKALGYPVSEFHHGPFAMVGEDIPVFLLACDEKTDANVVEMADKVLLAGGEPCVFTNKKEIAEKYQYSFLLPAEAEGVLGAFSITTGGQMFANYLSLSKGLSPDTPRGLKKVTVTK